MSACKSSLVNCLTGVYVRTNLDGVHTKDELIGYIDQHPFIVLERWIGDEFYIQQYEDTELYPMYMVGHKYAIVLKNEGYSYNLKNYYKPKVKDVYEFSQLFWDDIKCACIFINEEYKEEYLTMIQACLDNGNENIQYALDIKLEDLSMINTEDPRYIIYNYYRGYNTAKANLRRVNLYERPKDEDDETKAADNMEEENKEEGELL